MVGFRVGPTYFFFFLSHSLMKMLGLFPGRVLASYRCAGLFFHRLSARLFLTHQQQHSWLVAIARWLDPGHSPRGTTRKIKSEKGVYSWAQQTCRTVLLKKHCEDSRLFPVILVALAHANARQWNGVHVLLAGCSLYSTAPTLLSTGPK